MAISAGKLREMVVVETPTEVRNALGESEQTWSTFAAARPASVEALSYNEQEQRGQIGGATSYRVELRYLAGLTGKMRLRWSSRDDRILYISGVIETGRREGLELDCQEQAS